MQRQHYTSGLKKIPDKIYSDQDILAFYDADLAKEAANDRKIYNTPPDMPGPNTCLILPDFNPILAMTNL